MSPIFTHIQSIYGELPQKMRRIADFILQQQEQVALLTGREIAVACETSPATVARFFRIIGYDKFHVFANEVKMLLKEQHLPLRKIKESFDFQTAGNPGDPLEQVCFYERQNIDALVAFPMQDRFEEALQLMAAASSICLVGDRSAYALVHYAGSVLRSFSVRIDFFASGDGMRYEKLESLTRDDLLIGVSFHRYVRSTWNLMRFAWERGVKVLAVTDHARSPLARVSTCCLLAPNKAPFYSYTAAMVLFNALIRGYALRRRELAQDFERRAAMLLDNEVYIKPVEMEQNVSGATGEG